MDPVKKAWHTVTQRWWNTRLDSVRGCISPYVVEEISAGDPVAAQVRPAAARQLDLLDTDADVEVLAEYLVLGGGLPAKARFDALHIACAAYHGANVVLTWNFKHIANPIQLPVLRGLCAARGYRLPELVSPLELLES